MSEATTTPVQNELPAAAAAAASDPFSGINLSGRSAIVVDLSTGRTLYSQNPDTQLPLASLTKLITLYAAGHILSPDSLVSISSSSLAQDGEYGLAQGETFTYQDLARFALVGSSNDAAQAIAEAASAAEGVSMTAFMADAVRSAGLSHTIAINGTGLDVDATEAGSYGTARDIAKLTDLFLRSAPAIARATTKGSVTAYSTAGAAHTLPNTNPDVGAMAGLELSKTGYTDLAGGNLAVVFDAGINHPIAIVVLGSTHDARFTDVERLMRATRTYLAQAPQ
jgi:D-alanyl-D-alanine carboxypeptidase (penicillin-binding protein 5/6)